MNTDGSLIMNSSIMIAKFGNWLSELNISQARKATEIFLSSGGKKRYDEIFNGQDRLYYDFSGESPKEITSPTLDKVSAALSEDAYVLVDYVEGTCRKQDDQKRIMKVQRVLHKMGKDDLAQEMNIDPVRDSAKSKSKMKVVISRHGIDIAGQSTDRNWTSCKELSSGMNAKYVWTEISAGALVAYLVKSDDLNIKKPIARQTISVFRMKGKSDVIAFYPTSSVYGNYRQDNFQNFIIDWCTEANKKLNSLPGSYFIDPACHHDMNPEVSLRTTSTAKDHLLSLLPSSKPSMVIKTEDTEKTFLDIFDEIAKLSNGDAMIVTKNLRMEPGKVAFLLDKGSLKDITRMVEKHSFSLSQFITQSQSGWKSISPKRKQELYEIFEKLAGGKELAEEILKVSSTPAGKFFGEEFSKKYK